MVCVQVIEKLQLLASWARPQHRRPGSTPESEGTSRPALGTGQSWDDTPLGSVTQCHPYLAASTTIPNRKLLALCRGQLGPHCAPT